MAPRVAVLAVVLAKLDKEVNDSLELVLRNEELSAAPVGLWTTQIDGRLLDGDLDTLCAGANSPCIGRHSKYLIYYYYL